MKIFYNKLNGQTKIVVDSAIEETLMSKTVHVVYSLLVEIATNSYQWPNEHSSAKKVVGLYEVDTITILTTQMSSLTPQIATLASQ